MQQAKTEYANRLNDHAMAIYRTPHPPVATVLTMLNLALELAPDSDMILSNIGLVSWNSGAVDVARKAFRAAVAINPKEFSNQLNGMLFSCSVGEWDAARDYQAGAAALDLDNPDVRLDWVHIRLGQGDWAGALADYDVRCDSLIHRYRKMPYPMWHGEDLNHRTFYVEGEQGAGDHILFSRYLAWVHEKWPDCRIIFGVRSDMMSLFWAFEQFVELVPANVPWPHGVDYGCYLFSLARFHGTTPDNIPPDPGLISLRVDNEFRRCSIRQPPFPALKVAVCWTGTPGQSSNIGRSVPFSQILSLAENPRVALYSVQCGPGRADIERHQAGAILTDLGADLEQQGWIGTAVALREFDLVITVCTSVAHLAGALGVPCWLLLCQEPYWVWLRSGDWTAWYPSMRLFRQERFADWTGVIAEVRRELAVLTPA